MDAAKQEEKYEYHTSQYDPPSQLLSWWKTRHKWHPVAENVRDVHWTCRVFFELFDPELVVYIHGSFARGLQTDGSDVNLYIPSHTRKDFERAWAKSNLRKPRADDPGVGVSVNELLGDELGCDVTIYFCDDGCSWVDRDVKVQIFPPLEDGYPRETRPIKNRRPYLVKVLRKCWYRVQQFRVGETETPTPQSDIFNMEERIRHISELDSKLSIENIRLTLVIFDVSWLLVHSVQKKEWRKWLPEYCQTILPMVDRYNQLRDQVNHPEVGYDEGIWNTIANKFEELAAKICSFEGQLLRI